MDDGRGLIGREYNLYDLAYSVAAHGGPPAFQLMAKLDAVVLEMAQFIATQAGGRVDYAGWQETLLALPEQD